MTVDAGSKRNPNTNVREETELNRYYFLGSDSKVDRISDASITVPCHYSKAAQARVPKDEDSKSMQQYILATNIPESFPSLGRQHGLIVDT